MTRLLPDNRRANRGRRGFTLMELVVSMAITAVLLGSISAAMFITVQALPNGKRAADVVLPEFNALEQMTSELAYALHFTERSATAVAFTVADRDSDGVPERIRYAWSGTAGDALTRAYNGAAAAVLADLREFDLGFQLKQVTEQYPGPLVEGPEVVLHSHGTVSGSAGGFPIRDDDWPGQYFSPTLPADAASWSITRVLLYARRDGAGSGETLVQLRTADQNNLPTSTIIEQQSMWEAFLGLSYGWHELVYSDVTGLVPGQGLCLLAEHNSGGTAAVIMYDSGGGASGAFNTHDGGDSWSYFNTVERLHYIYGKIIAPGPTQNAVRNYVTAVSVVLRSGDEAASRLMTTVQTLNCPEALSDVWETDFDIDPLVDLNGDGQADWIVGGGSHSESSVSSGIWYADARLDTSPDSDFDKLTTVTARFRDTSSGDERVTVRVNADKVASIISPIIADLELQADGTQTLTILGRNDAGWVVFYTRTGLDSGFVTVRLLIDPVLDTVSVTVNFEHVGTYAYPSQSASGVDRVAYMRPRTSDAEFDYISVRVGE